MSCRYLFALAIAALLLAGCAQQPARLFDYTLTDNDLQRVLCGGPLLAECLVWKQPTSPRLLAVNNSMRSFLDINVPRSASPDEKLKQLLRAIHSADSLGFRYDPLRTLNATETFKFQEGNCLSFSSLIVALARELGLKASFNEVDIPPAWGQLDDGTQVYFRHINVVVRTPRDKYVVDLNLASYDTAYPQRKVSDSYAEAQFYNNIAMNFLFNEDLEFAFINIRKAIDLEPELAFLWANLGAVYRRAGHLAEAEISYKQALELDPKTVIAVSNLGHLYLQMGQIEKAEWFNRLANSFRMKNPYYLYYLAEIAYREERLDEALLRINQAIKRSNKEGRFYLLSAKINRALGNPKAVRSSLEKAGDLVDKKTLSGISSNKLKHLATQRYSLISPTGNFDHSTKLSWVPCSTFSADSLWTCHA